MVANKDRCPCGWPEVLIVDIDVDGRDHRPPGAHGGKQYGKCMDSDCPHVWLVRDPGGDLEWVPYQAM
jgi:hypothetical protein